MNGGTLVVKEGWRYCKEWGMDGLNLYWDVGSGMRIYPLHTPCFLLSNSNYSPAIPRIPCVSPEMVHLKEHEMEQVQDKLVRFNPMRLPYY